MVDVSTDATAQPSGAPMRCRRVKKKAAEAWEHSSRRRTNSHAHAPQVRQKSRGDTGAEETALPLARPRTKARKKPRRALLPSACC